MGKLLVGIGIALVLIGLFYQFFPATLNWFGNLPGDIKIEKENSKVYFPIVSMIVVSIIFNILLKLYRYYQ